METTLTRVRFKKYLYFSGADQTYSRTTPAHLVEKSKRLASSREECPNSRYFGGGGIWERSRKSWGFFSRQVTTTRHKFSLTLDFSYFPLLDLSCTLFFPHMILHVLHSSFAIFCCDIYLLELYFHENSDHTRWESEM